MSISESAIIQKLNESSSSLGESKMKEQYLTKCDDVRSRASLLHIHIIPLNGIKKTYSQMYKSLKVDWTSIDDKIQKVSFDLFRFWTNESGINDTLLIKTEQTLVADLKKAIVNAIHSLNNNKDLDKKPIGWDIGFIIGFVDGNLGKHWYHEYIVKNSEEYKTFKGLRAIETYLKTNEIAEIKINKIYEDLLDEDSNILNSNLKIRETDLDEKRLEIVQNAKRGMILTILNNLIMERIKVVAELENKVLLPIGDYFTTSELKRLIEDNKKKTH